MKTPTTVQIIFSNGHPSTVSLAEARRYVSKRIARIDPEDREGSAAYDAFCAGPSTLGPIPPSLPATARVPSTGAAVMDRRPRKPSRRR